MSLNHTPSSERLHIAVFGRRNAGKSSVVNAITGQDLAIVSEVKGTTTDPVYKAMELLPIGPVVIIDTPGLDDEGDLGSLRMQKSYDVLNKTDVALLIVDAEVGKCPEDEAILARIQQKNIPYLTVYNKSDLQTLTLGENEVTVSAKTGEGVFELKETITTLAPKEQHAYPLIADLVQPNDFVVLVIPIDSAAPKGRLILPQQQVIRDLLEAGAVSIVVKETELADTLATLGDQVKLVVTDSQAFAQVSKETPQSIALTSFSILFSRYKGNLGQAIEGATMLDQLEDGDCVLIAEGCTHHRQCDDIGTVKLPKWIAAHTGKNIEYRFVSGTEFPDDLTPYKLVVHCGGCMLNEREMKYRLQCAADRGMPMTNYGTAIAYMNGILKRTIEPFEEFTCLIAD